MMGFRAMETDKDDSYLGFAPKELLNSVGLNFHDLFLKQVVRDKRLALYPGFIVIDRIDGVIQDLRNFFRVRNTHPDQGKDPQLCI